MPLCFVIMPFGADGSQEREYYDSVFELVIRDPIERAGFTCERADKIPYAGNIMALIQDKLATADLVVADLSKLNPNVVYELGVRHALKLPALAITGDHDQLPFNIASLRTIRYRMDNVPICRRAIQEIEEYAKTVAHEPRTHSIDNKDSTSVEGTGTTAVETSLLNIHSLVSTVAQRVDSIQSNIKKVQSDQSESQSSTVISILKNIQESLPTLVSGVSRLTDQASRLGLVSIYGTRLDAIEQELFDTLERESVGIGIVSSTMSGFRGHSRATLPAMLDLLHRKVKQGVNVRLLLTHWDKISSRQDQEMKDKPLDRYVISSELLTAFKLLKEKELLGCTKVYKGSPTCFTVVCEGQKLMMVNPYPYQREAINSWTVLFRDAPGGAFDPFKTAHLDMPWQNDELAIQLEPHMEALLLKRLNEDMEQARVRLSKEFDPGGSSAPSVKTM